MDYKEKLEEAKRLYQTANTDQRYVLESLFPELNKESEDEKVRKALIEMVHDTTGDSLWIDYNVHKSEAIAWLEKQGEQKPILDFKAKDWYVSKVDGKIHNIYYSVDKVEPKFKVGDFIVNDYCMGKVIELTNDAYLLDTGQGIPFSCEHNAHLWTIADAKDGDVLCTYECGAPKIVFILKGTPKKHYALSYHCYYNIMYPHFASDSEKGCLAPNDKDVKPASKIQRDLLFQKMKEAGYMWDSGSKQLLSLKAEPSGEQKPAWSEEDEVKINRIVACLENLNVADNDILLKDVDWLKSLKERIGG